VFASTSNASTYDYDPFGNTLTTAAPLTDFGYAGMFYNAASGLSLTRYRAYDPAVGRWLSRDPWGEVSDPGANLYSYVQNDPINGIDSTGLATLQVGASGAVSLPFGLSVPIGFGLAVDSEGHVAVYEYAGGGATVGASVEGGVSIQVSNAQTVCDLSGLFFNTSAHAGAGLGGSADYFTGNSPDGPVAGGGVTIGGAAGASISGGATDTALYVLR
jgi:RHS repeat-associated protein